MYKEDFKNYLNSTNYCLIENDPIYQELGEALFCWFLSVVKKYAEQLNIK